MSNDPPPWPVPQFRFSVDWDGLQDDISFLEVSGLEANNQEISYRHGNSSHFPTTELPGISKFENVTLRRGIFADGHKFWNWFNQVKMNAVTRATVVIKLMDENDNLVMSWTLTNAFPTKITGNDFKSAANEIVVESIDIVHEGVTVSIAN
jgi:phage tail-like protein